MSWWDEPTKWINSHGVNDGIKFSATMSSDKQQIDREKKKKKDGKKW